MVRRCSIMVLYGDGHRSTARECLLDGKNDIGDRKMN